MFVSKACIHFWVFTRESLFFMYPFSKYPLKLLDAKVIGFAGNLHRIRSDMCKQTLYPVRKWKWCSVNAVHQTILNQMCSLIVYLLELDLTQIDPNLLTEVLSIKWLWITQLCVTCEDWKWYGMLQSHEVTINSECTTPGYIVWHTCTYSSRGTVQ